MLHVRLFPDLATDRWVELNLNEEFKKYDHRHASRNPALDPVWCSGWVEGLHVRRTKSFSYGGYLEDRSDLWAGHYQQPGCVFHLGMDFNVPYRALVSMPANGRLVLAEDDPDTNGGWGGRSIFKINDAWVIFGHMYRLHGLVGQDFDAGEPIGLVAPPEKNGGWFPHLHVQVMTKYDRAADGYSRLYAGIEKDFPDPEEFFRGL